MSGGLVLRQKNFPTGEMTKADNLARVSVWPRSAGNGMLLCLMSTCCCTVARAHGVARKHRNNN